MRRRHNKTLKFMAFIGVVLAVATVGFSTWSAPIDSTSKEFGFTDSSARAVCYNSTTGTRYSSIEKALETSQSGQQIYVYPDLKDSSGNLTPIYISRDCTVPSGVTLNLPYSGTTYFNADEHGTWDGSNYFADQTTARVKQFRKTQVILNESINMTVNGTLNIGGVCSVPTQRVAGSTAGEYCEVTMSKNSTIVCNGTINCYGYIKRTASDNNAMMTVNESATLLSPFVIYDFKGGWQTIFINNISSSSDKFCPFQLFDLCNIQTKTKVMAGGYWKARASIYIDTTSTYYPTSEKDKVVTFVGPTATSTALVLKSGYVVVDYVPKTNGITTYTTGSGKTNINIFGNVDIGSLKISVAVIVTITMDTNNFFFPVSYRFSFTIENGGVLNVSKRVKLMTGSGLTINPGGTLNVSSSLISYDNFSDPSGISFGYPSGLSASRLINNGVINVTGTGAIGGFIETQVAGAKINYQSSNTSVASPEYGGNMPQAGGGLGDIVSSLSKAPDVSKITRSPEGVLTKPYARNVLNGSIEYTSYLFDGLYGWDSASLPEIQIVIPGGYSFAEIKPGKTIQLSHNYYANIGLTWVSSNLSVATVNSTGLVTGVSDGTTEIRLVTPTGAIKATAQIIVSSSAIIYPQSVEISVSSGTTTSKDDKKEATATLIAQVTPEDAVVTYEWSYAKDGNFSDATCNIVPSEDGKTATVTFVNNDRQATRTFQVWCTVTSTDGKVSISSNKITITATKQCLLPTAQILMADGSYKNAGDIRTGDMVMSLNHETGAIEPNVIIGNDDIMNAASNQTVVHLEFSGGLSTDFVDEHGFFDLTLNKYVYLHNYDVDEFIGHEFVSVNDLSVTPVILTEYSVSEQFTKVCSPVTANGFNIISDDMLSIGGGLDGLFNIFEYDPTTLAFDPIKKQADIDEYGLLGYDAFEQYFPEEIYNILPCKYLAVSIGKGMITWDEFSAMVDKWKDQLLENL